MYDEQMAKKEKEEKNKDSQKDVKKIAAIREMISNAQRTIESAKAMLAQIEGTSGKKPARVIPASTEEGEIVEGVFDGQVMIGTDGKQYPVPANYASKSKLVEGDMLKLTITPDGSFIYKQIGPAERKTLIGIVSQDDLGNYVIIAGGKAYRVLLASITYFKAEPGDEVALIVPRDSEAVWGAIENVIKKGSAEETRAFNSGGEEPSEKAEEKIGKDGKLESEARDDIIDEWTPELEKLREEASKPVE